jgi:hypothetical protein
MKATRGRVALLKLPRNRKRVSVNFARSAFGVRCVLAPLLQVLAYRATSNTQIDER